MEIEFFLSLEPRPLGSSLKYPSANELNPVKPPIALYGVA